MPSTAAMRVGLAIDAETWPIAAERLMRKMEGVCPGATYEVAIVTCAPAPGGSPPRIAGPPWRFTIECACTVIV